MWLNPELNSLKTSWHTVSEFSKANSKYIATLEDFGKNQLAFPSAWELYWGDLK